MREDLRRVDLSQRYENGSIEDISNKVRDTWEVGRSTSGQYSRRKGRHVVRIEAESKVGDGGWRLGGQRWRRGTYARLPRSQYTGSMKPGPFQSERKKLTFDQAPWIGTEIAELADFDPSLESENPLDSREGVAIAS